MQDVRSMQIGQLVDFVIDYNDRNEPKDKSGKRRKKPTKRKATQADIDVFFG